MPQLPYRSGCQLAISSRPGTSNTSRFWYPTLGVGGNNTSRPNTTLIHKLNLMRGAIACRFWKLGSEGLPACERSAPVGRNRHAID
jgi:hypothetical protein